MPGWAALALAVVAAGPLLPQLPAPTASFARPAEAAAAAGRFEGRLALGDSAGATVRVIRDDYGHADRLAPVFRTDPLPDFEFDFVQVGDALVPLRRGVTESSHSAWDLILESGQVWADRGGQNLGAIPFALQERDANCTHYGLLLFRYDPKGSTGDAAWQIGSETCAYFQFDGWGEAKVRYTPRKLSGSAAAAAAFHGEHLDRKSSSIEELRQSFPAVGELRLPDPVKASDLTLFGVAIDGRHYASQCPTRFGPHPYCDTLPLPSYSLAKTLFGGLALMRAELLGPGTMRQRIAELVPQCAAWGEVTLADTLDMTTGRYASDGYEVDENGPATARFLDSGTHAERIALACTAFPRRENPGERWVYHTTDSYVLGAALTALAAPQDIHRDLLVAPIWKRLGLSPVSTYTRRTRDAAAQPYVGYGLTFQRGDLVKIADFLQRGGLVEGKPLVDPRQLAAGMQRDPSDRGLEAGIPGFRYQNSFWARDVGKLVGCATPRWVPFLSGYGGVSLVLFPNGVSYYSVSDGFTYDWSNAAKVAHRIRSLCPAEARA